MLVHRHLRIPDPIRVAAYLAAAVFCLLAGTGCEDDSDGEAPVAATNTASTAESGFFPDGLHPNAAGNRIVATAFAAALGGTPGGDNNPNTVVCLGDSITAGGYPSDLAALTGKNAVNEGVPGESSAGGASRVAGVLGQYNPGFLCILYGINDLNGGAAPADVIPNLQAIVQAAKNRGTIPILATLTPVSGVFAGRSSAVRDLNALIRGLAAAEGVALADLERAFGG